MNLPAGNVTVALQDLTGFDGRCDAVCFSRDASPRLPNDDLIALSDWKDRLAGRAGMSPVLRAVTVGRPRNSLPHPQRKAVHQSERSSERDEL